MAPTVETLPHLNVRNLTNPARHLTEPVTEGIVA